MLNNRIRLNEYFYLDEYIPEYLYILIKDKEQLIQLIDPRLLEMDLQIRKYFGACIINNWATGGNRQWSGVRTSNSSYYSPNSQHSVVFSIEKDNKLKISRQCRASDKIIGDIDGDGKRTIKDYDKIREFIIANPQKFKDIKGIEMGVNWLHTDVRSSDKLIKFFK